MKRLLTYLVLMSLTGCSFVVAEKNIAGENEEFAIFEPRLVGDWVEAEVEGKPPAVYEEPKVGEFVRIERATPDSKALLLKEFVLHSAADGGEPTEVQQKGPPEQPIALRVVRLGDVEVISASRLSTSEGCHIVRLEWIKDGFQVSLMDTKFFEKHPQLIAHRMKEKDVIITADAEAIHEFLKTHGKRADLWEKASPVIVRRKRPADAK